MKKYKYTITETETGKVWKFTNKKAFNNFLKAFELLQIEIIVDD